LVVFEKEKRGQQSLSTADGGQKEEMRSKNLNFILRAKKSY
jgi:hypothetical protein